MNRTLKSVLLSSATVVILYDVVMGYIKQGNPLRAILANAAIGAVISLIAIAIYKLTKKK